MAWLLTDHQNSVRDIVLKTGTEWTVENHLTYAATGEILDESGQTAPASAWTGRYLDAATAKQYNTTRWYDLALSRWLSEDPIAFAGDLGSLYRYCGNDPVNWIDPRGMKVYRFAWRSDLGSGILFMRSANDAEMKTFLNRFDPWTILFVPQELTQDEQRLVDLAKGDPQTEETIVAILNVLRANIPSSSRHFANYWGSYVGWHPYPEEEYPRITGFCGAWVDFHFPRMPRSTKYLRIIKVDFVVVRGYAGHNAIRLEFGDAQGITAVVYLDNGWKGGSDHIFFPKDIPTGKLGNEMPSRLIDGKPAPFAAPLPTPPSPRRLTQAQIDAAIERMYHPPSGLRPAGGW